MFISGVALLILLFSAGNPQPMFLSDHFPKEIRTYIQDQERKKEVIALYHRYEKETRPLRKLLNKNKKRIKRLNLSKKTPVDSLAQLLTQSLDLRQKIHLDGVSYRLEIQMLILPGEWDVLTAQSGMAAGDSLRAKMKAELRLELSEIKPVMATYITDPFRATEIYKAHTTLTNRFERIIETNTDTLASCIFVFMNRKASEEELKQAVLTENMIKPDLFSALTDFNQVLKAYTTHEEWYRIAKKLNRRY